PSANQRSLSDLRTTATVEQSASTAKLVGCRVGDSVVEPRIAVRVVNIGVVHDDGSPIVRAPAAAIVAATVPRMPRFEGSQRHPSDVAEAKSDVESSPAKSEKRDQSRTPEVTLSDSTRP